jgi:hypothetical protein
MLRTVANSSCAEGRNREAGRLSRHIPQPTKLHAARQMPTVILAWPCRVTIRLGCCEESGCGLVSWLCLFGHRGLDGPALGSRSPKGRRGRQAPVRVDPRAGAALVCSSVAAEGRSSSARDVV